MTTTYMSTDDIRRGYLEFFAGKGAKLCASDSLVPANDPTLLFTGAGMNQFKDYFLGIGKMDFRMATSCQKCIRTGDIMNVGVTPCHHTFFEMLGNFSFGSYFKKEAIEWGWEFLTGVMKLPESRLQVSVYHTDDEAFNFWKNLIGLPESKINRLGDHDNFWPADAPQNGPNGPCGPCSEIFFDRGAKYGEDRGITGENRRWVEIWNLVFTQFDRRDGGVLEPLPQCNIDTGMGLERMASCMQGVATNMDIDIFVPLVQAVADMSGKKYGAEHASDVAMRRIADHARAVAFCISDGVLPGNTHRGYILKRLLRRAALDGRGLGIREAFINELVPVVSKVMGGQYPEVVAQEKNIREVIAWEEEKFLATLDKGLNLIEGAIEKTRAEKRAVFSGAAAFELYDTYGFPLELTEEIVCKEGLAVDNEGYQQALATAKETARAGAKMKGDVFAKGPVTEVKKLTGSTEFIGYGSPRAEGCKVIAIIRGETLAQAAQAGDEVTLVLDKTSFYGESGGQVGDTGCIHGLDNLEVLVEDTEKIDGIFFHVGRVESGALKVGDALVTAVDVERRTDICRNHTATHLLHKALQTVLGPDAVQKGSYVTPERLRFDFQYSQSLTPDQRRQIAEIVNGYLLAASPVVTEVKSIEEAKAEGAMALFGEKYGDTVRMVRIGDYSRELCGGTHIDNTARIGAFHVVAQEAVGSGVRRIEAVTGHYAFRFARQVAEVVMNVAQELNTGIEGMEERVRSLLEQEKEMRKEIAALKADQVKNALASVAPQQIGDLQYVAINAGAVMGKELAAAADGLRQRLGDNGVCVLAGSDGEKVALVITVGKALVQKGVKAGDLVKTLAPMVGGSGGGKPEMAQAGGKDPEKLAGMLCAVPDVLAGLAK